MPDGLALQGIGVRFGGLVALEDVSLRVAPGTVQGIIGPNGAGKTTLFNVICGFVNAQVGSMTWQGRPFRPRPHQLARAGISRTLQALGLFDHQPVLDNVMTGANCSGTAGFAAALGALPRSDREERRLRAEALECLEMLGVAQYAGRYPGSLPHAIRKKVALARALVAKPNCSCSTSRPVG